jgi:hypothetical protein
VSAPTKGDVLQALLDTQQLCLELFDAVEASALDVDRPTLMKLGGLIRVLTATYEGMAMHYILSGHASDDFLDNVRQSLGE